jgi:putative ABC transport system permease protein
MSHDARTAAAGLRQDVRVAVRGLLASRFVSSVAVLTLAIAIGATTAVFSIVNAILLRPLPVPDPDRLMSVSSDFAISRGFTAGAGWSAAMWERLRPLATRFDGAFAWQSRTFTVGRGLETTPVNGMYASGEFFTTLGIGPTRGRLFRPTDDVRGGGPEGLVAVIGYRFWQRHFAGAEEVIGTPLVVEGTSVTIAGVLPKTFLGLEVGTPVDVVLPLGAEPVIRGRDTELFQSRNFLLLVMLRLRADQSRTAATALLRSLQADIVPPGAPVFVQEPFTLVPAAGGPTGPAGMRPLSARPLLTMLLGVSLVLVIACVNIANLLLARVTARRRELAMRLALGASRWQVARHHMAESVALAIAGAAAGLTLSPWIARAMVALSSAVPDALALSVDWRVILFAATVTLAAAILCGAAPVFQVIRIAPAVALRSGTEDARVSGTRRISDALVVLQVALAVVLAVAAGLLIRTFTRLSALPLGFDPGAVIVMNVETARTAGDPADRLQLFQRIEEAARTTPGVTRGAASLWTPLSGEGAVIGMREPEAADRAEINVVVNFISPGWLATYGTPLKEGRDFTRQDTARAPPVVIVNQAFARRFMRGARALGQTIRDGQVIVGVSGDAVFRSSQRIPGVASLALREPVPPTIYAPLAQYAAWNRPASTRVRLSLRSAIDPPLAVVPAVGAALTAVDPALEFTARALSDDVTASLSQEGMHAGMAGAFGALSLFLATLGLYGMTSYSVSRRRSEIGIRLAVGARRVDVIGLVLDGALRLVAAGIVLGLAGAFGLTRTLSGVLFGVTPLDPITFVVFPALIAAVATVAAFVPARRASLIDPAPLLRRS